MWNTQTNLCQILAVLGSLLKDYPDRAMQRSILIELSTVHPMHFITLWSKQPCEAGQPQPQSATRITNNATQPCIKHVPTPPSHQHSLPDVYAFNNKQCQATVDQACSNTTTKSTFTSRCYNFSTTNNATQPCIKYFPTPPPHSHTLPHVISFRCYKAVEMRSCITFMHSKPYNCYSIIMI